MSSDKRSASWAALDVARKALHAPRATVRPLAYLTDAQLQAALDLTRAGTPVHLPLFDPALWPPERATGFEHLTTEELLAQLARSTARLIAEAGEGARAYE
jgi:hypothetical protein